jgi:2-polyprenyl-3-methyl-5-hydroxy-6-metoxy-1,4-benzoquinol methylase
MSIVNETSSSTTTPSTDPAAIFRIATGFMAAKALFAASELGLFEALAESPAPLEALAARCGLTPRATRISADAMVALGLLERDDQAYRNGAVAATFLSGRTPADLRPLLRFWDKVSYPATAQLASALSKGPSGAPMSSLSGEIQQIAQAGIAAATAGPLRALIATAKLADRRRLLDIGGGNGSWSIGLARANAHLYATVVDLPTVTPITTQSIASAQLSERVTARAANALRDTLPGGHDVCLLANLIHYFAPADNRALLRNIRSAVEPGCRLLIADFWTDRTHTEPLMAALMAGEFAVHEKDGDVYSVDEGRAWLTETGWRFTTHEPLAGPFSLVTAEAV